MLSGIDVIAWLVCAAAWLGPFAWNAAAGRMRLLHPNAIFPIIIVYMCIPPLHYRFYGETILRTSETWSNGTWFLAVPMLWLALFGVFYHLGVRAAGLPSRLGADDATDVLLPLEVLQGVSPRRLFSSALVVLGLMVLASLAMPREHYAKGFYFMHLFFMGFQVLPVLVLAQDRRLGQIFLLLAAPSGLLLRSKAAFLYLAIALVLFFQQGLFRISKFASACVVGLVLLTPFAVARYATVTAYADDIADPYAERWVGWDEALDRIETREYAFESFVCVYNWRLQGGELTWGRTLLGELTQMVPSALWPDKPFKFFDFPSKYLPADLRSYETHFARHVATLFFLDFGIPGCLLGFGCLGFFNGWCYRTALQVSLQRRESWPMVLNLCWVIQAKYLVDGGFAGAIPNALGALLGVGLALAGALVGGAKGRGPGVASGQRPASVALGPGRVSGPTERDHASWN